MHVITDAFFHRPKDMFLWLIDHPSFSLGVISWLSVCVGPVVDWRSVQVVSGLLFAGMDPQPPCDFEL